MRFGIGSWSLAGVLLTLLIGCGQPPTPPSGAFEVSDEAGNSVTTQAVPTNGLKGEYFDNVDFTGTLKTRYDATVNRNWGTAAPITGIQPTTYSVRWTGQVLPAFSQTYTFFVTSSDGARLMVNGQVLVNDWVDGTSRVRSGTVALQANVKYDIRLEYYRNATNPGSVKLEWQSPSRTRQVVPQVNLFTTGSNLATALTALKANSAFNQLSTTLDDSTARGSLEQSGFHLQIIEADRNGVLRARVNPSQRAVDRLQRNRYDGNVIKIHDVLTGRIADLGPIGGLVSADGSLIEPDSVTFTKKVSPLLGAENSVFLNYYLGSTTSPANRTGGLVRPQGLFDVELPFKVCDNCKETARTLARSLLVFTTAQLASVMTDLTLNVRTAASRSALQIAVGALIKFCQSTIIDGVSLDERLNKYCTKFDFADDLRNGNAEVLINAIAGELGPLLYDEKDPQNTGDKPVNKGIRDLKRCMDEQCAPPTLINEMVNPAPAAGSAGVQLSIEGSFKNSDAAAYPLEYRVGIVDNGISVIFPSIASGASGTVLPTEFGRVNISATCPAIPAEFDGALVVESNDPKRPIVSIPLRIVCNKPEISVAPNSLEFTAAINQSVTGVLNIANTGWGPLEVSNITPNASWLSVSTSSFTGTNAIEPNASKQAQVTAQCGSTLGEKTSTIIVSSNAQTTPVEINAKLQCVTDAVNIIAIWHARDCGTVAEPILCTYGIMRDPVSGSGQVKDYRQSYNPLVTSKDEAGNLLYALAKSDLVASYPYPRAASGGWQRLSNVESTPVFNDSRSACPDPRVFEYSNQWPPYHYCTYRTQ
jgi:PA14 domain